MSHLGPWSPATVEQRLDRLESLASIQQLAYRYALAIDSRNISDLVALFVPDVRVGREESGRDALAGWFTRVLRESRVSAHFVANHVIDFESADRATGIVYCDDELEKPDAGHWQHGKLQYWDTYARVGGEWLFERRRFLRWYIVDALERPAPGAGTGGDRDALTTHLVPDAFPSWSRFWAEAEER